MWKWQNAFKQKYHLPSFMSTYLLENYFISNNNNKILTKGTEMSTFTSLEAIWLHVFFKRELQRLISEEETY